MKKKILILIILLIFVLSGLFSANKYYNTGDTVFSFNGGINLPDFILFSKSSDNVFGFDTHIQVGGTLGLSYQVFLTNSLALGGSLSYRFNSSISSDLFVLVPITAKLSYYPFQSEKFDLILSVDAGISYFRYLEGKYVSPYVGISISPSYFFTKSWGLGLEAGINVNYDIYFASSSNNKSLHNAFGFFSPITLKVIYRH